MANVCFPDVICKKGSDTCGGIPGLGRRLSVIICGGCVGEMVRSVKGAVDGVNSRCDWQKSDRHPRDDW